MKPCSTTLAVAAGATLALATLLLLLVMLLVPVRSSAQVEIDPEGQVELPLSSWRALDEASGGGSGARVRDGAASLGLAQATVDVEEREGRIVATVGVTVAVRARAAGDRAILLPPATALVSATVDGAAIALAPTTEGLAWIAEAAGEHRIELRYEVEGGRYDSGASLALPLPRAPSVHLVAELPAGVADVAIVPAIGARTTRTGDALAIEATIPGGGAAHLAWRALSAIEEAVPSRAIYRGVLGDDAIRFDVELGVDLASDAAVPVALFPTDVALGAVEVDGDDAPIRVIDGRTAAIVRGRGRHTIRASFELPLSREGGLPRAIARIPEVPVSRFEIAMPADKDVRVIPASAVSREARRGASVAVFHVPLTDEVRLEWPEALPAESATGDVERRASAALVHVLRAEEGLLRGRVRTAWDIARGSASRYELTVPAGVDVGTVAADVASVADWRLAGDRGRERTLIVFLDRAVSGSLVLTIDFEVLLGGAATGQAFDVPLLAARDVARQSGMVALLTTRELGIEPRGAEAVARVGENQLPPEVRADIDATVAHVFRWTDAPPRFQAITGARPREAARFDARIDTLVSLGDVTTSASASIDVRVKSGTLGELAIALPRGASLLDVSAPSLREHSVGADGDHPVARLFFTQEMEGELRIDLRWERIAAVGDEEVEAPMAHVVGADVEQGRVAIEATAAVEIEPRITEGLSPIDLGELPEELVLRSTCPILLAFRYAHAAPAPTLALSVARHTDVALRDAAIDDAIYRTLITDDGLAVTTATWIVRNQRQQFLRIALPRGAEIWSARVGGRAETPALASNAGDPAPVILVGVLRSLEPFEVEITYATPVAAVGLLGRIEAELARPDVVATHARWEVFLPAFPRWGEPTSDLALVERGVYVDARAASAALTAQRPSGLAIAVPTEGVRWVFEDVYVGREGRAIRASFPYASGWGVVIGWLLALAGALLAWTSVLGIAMARAGKVLVPEGGPFELATYRFASAARQVAVSRKGLAALVATAALGGAMVVLALWLGTSPAGPIATSAIVALGLALALRKRITASLAALRERLAPPVSASSSSAPLSGGDRADSPSAR
jgi:hypothetical protein